MTQTKSPEQEARDFEIASAVGQSTAKHIFEKAKEKAMYVDLDDLHGEFINLQDLQTICQIKEQEERKEATQEEFLKEG